MNVDCIDPLNRAVAAQVAHLLAHKRTCAPAVRARRCGYGRPTPETRRRAADRHTEEVYTVAFSPDGTRIVSGSSDLTVRVWDANTGQPVGNPLTGHGGIVKSVAF